MNDDFLDQNLCQTALSDRAAFKRLYDQSAPILLSVIKRIVVDAAIAEDVLQETFIKIWHQAQSYRPEKSRPMTWLTSIARNCAIDNLRKNKHQTRTLSLDAESIVVNDDMAHSDPEVAMGSHRLIGCMEKLAPEQRQAILASYCEGYSHRELSESLATPVGTIKSWIRRSLLALKKCLNQ